MIRILALFFTLVSLSTVVSALPASVEDELQRHIKVFEGDDTFRQKQVTQTLEWSGLNQASLFDLIEAKLTAQYKTNKNRQDADYLSWMAKALAFSGNEKYRSTLEAVANDAASNKLKRYAKSAQEDLSKHQRLNPIILDESRWDDSQSADMNRFRIMIQSDELELKRMAAKRVHYDHMYDTELLDLFEAQLKANFKSNSSDHLFVDTWAWVCKAIAGSRKIEYKSTVELVSESAGNKKLRKYAKKYLKYYGS